MLELMRARRALSGMLDRDERVHAVAVDDASGTHWVTTTTHLVVLKNDRIAFRTRLAQLAGSIKSEPTGVTVVARRTDDGHVVVATFRRANKVTRRLSDLLAVSSGSGQAPAATDDNR